MNINYKAPSERDADGRFKLGCINPNKAGEFRLCLLCNKSFYAHRFKILEGKGKFCSQKCSAIYRPFKLKPCPKGVHRSIKTEFKKGQRSLMGMLGKKQSEEFKRNLSLRMSGSNHPAWKGGIKRSVHLINRRIREKNAPGSHSKCEWDNLKESFGNRCLSCMKSEPEIKLTKDHVLPLASSGNNDITNIQPLCFRCNVIKNKRNFYYRRLFKCAV